MRVIRVSRSIIRVIGVIRFTRVITVIRGITD